MYTREANGKELELRVSGKLYKDALVMLDRETGTLWTQVDGSALRGPLAGHRLVEIPAMQTTWKVWKQLHPDTLVLRKPPEIRSSRYTSYFTDPSRHGLFGTPGDPRMDGKTLVIGVHVGDAAAAVPLASLIKQQFVELELAGQPLAVFYSREDQTPIVLRAVVDGRKLSFRLRGKGKQVRLEDQQTGSEWSPLEGRAVEGPLKGKTLEPFPYLLSYWYAWSAYRPQTRLVALP